MKVLALILLVIVVMLAFYFFPKFFGQGETAPCPAGSSYVRQASGGGWVPTDASDPWGQCIPDTTVQQSYNR